MCVYLIYTPWESPQPEASRTQATPARFLNGNIPILSIRQCTSKWGVTSWSSTKYQHSPTRVSCFVLMAKDIRSTVRPPAKPEPQWRGEALKQWAISTVKSITSSLWPWRAQEECERGRRKYPAAHSALSQTEGDEDSGGVCEIYGFLKSTAPTPRTFT